MLSTVSFCVYMWLLLTFSPNDIFSHIALPKKDEQEVVAGARTRLFGYVLPFFHTIPYIFSIIIITTVGFV